MSGPTPGPWSAPAFEKEGHDRGWWIHNGREGSDEFAVAVTFALNPNGEADARLIAAAPELLEKLRDLVALGRHRGRLDVAALDHAKTGVGPVYEPLRCIGWGLRVIGHIGTTIPVETSVACAREAARAAFRSVPGLRCEDPR